jgi:REP element-mobilizing transposase RayT
MRLCRLATEGWTDVFTRNEYKNMLVDNLAYSQKNKGLEIFTWCIMSNHLHLMVRATEGHLLQDILRDFKKFTLLVVVFLFARRTSLTSPS